MWGGNETESTNFILLGFFPEFRYITALVSIVLLIYMAAFIGNTLLVLLIWLDSRLHTPMYFLLSQLSLMDLTLTSSIIPKMVANFFSGWQSISFLACGTQIFFSLTVAIGECILTQTSPHSCPILPPSLVKGSFSNEDRAKGRRVPEPAQSLPKLYIH